MGHPPREDRPGRDFHLMLRAVSRRSLFDDDDDARGFLSLVARAARRGDLEVDAFCAMPNHVHLLVQSPRGALSAAMRDIESTYARGFNRRRDRLGHLVQARFRSKVVRSTRYREVLVAYIDANPVEAGIVSRPEEYPHGSARLYARDSGPRWLARARIEEYVRRRSPDGTYSPAAYAGLFGRRLAPGTRRWLRALLSSRHAATASLDELISAAPRHVLAWMDQRARSADGTARLAPMVDVGSIAAAIRTARRTAGERTINLRRKERPMWTLLEVGLLRDLAGLSFTQIGARLSLPTRTAHTLYGEHAAAMQRLPAYRESVESGARCAIERCHPTRILPAGV